MGHLDLSAQIRAVNDVGRMVSAGDEGHCAAQGQVHADAHFAVVQKCPVLRFDGSLWPVRLAQAFLSPELGLALRVPPGLHGEIPRNPLEVPEARQAGWSWLRA